MLIKFITLWMKSFWRSTISWTGLALCELRSIGSKPNIEGCKKIVVVQLGHFGDMVLTLPLLDSIKKRNPLARLIVVTTSAGAAVACAFGAQDQILVPNKQKTCFSILNRVDLIIYLRGGMLWLLSAFRRHHAGFIHGLPHRSALRWAPLVLVGIPLNRRSPEHQYTTIVRRMRTLKIRMPWRPMLRIETQEIPKGWPQNTRYVAIHAGGNWKPRRWDEDKFYKVCVKLWHNFGMRTLLIAAHESPALIQKLRSSDIPFYALEPEISVLSMARFIKGATIYLGNDSGPAHLAAALDIPCVVLYGPQDPRLLGVLSTTQKIVKGKAYCSPCWQLHCQFSSAQCMNNISVDFVLDEIISCIFERKEKQL